MNLYFMLIDAGLFGEQIAPALAASWRQRSFAPCRPLCAALAPAMERFRQRYHTGSDETMPDRLLRGLPFDRHFWTLLAGEVFLYAAEEVPELQVAPETLTCLLARDHDVNGIRSRLELAPIQQAHLGSRDLDFGGRVYRPEHAGVNDVADVGRLATYLQGVDPRRWTAAELDALPDLSGAEEREDELEFAREWFPALQDLYHRAREKGWIVVCEEIDTPLAG